jgi:hypothetical protein
MPDRNEKFAVVAVSIEAFDLIQDLEAAWCRFTTADSSDMQAVGDAYAALCQRRKELYQYLAGLEFNAVIPRTVHLRFN